MTRIAPVRMNMNPRTFWFDALDFEVERDQKVVVQTVRGIELATVAESVFESDESQTCKLKTPLKPIVRIATEEDIEQAREMEQLSNEAMPIFREFVEESNLDMRPVSVEYLLEGDKAVFYFESEDRVDFRELVRKLASHFHIRVDMRQIGVRDEARMIGGLGHCGQELCCARMGGDFNPVTIRMAKEQDLSLNPQKISGTCGRLMCCLRYEFDAYKDFNSRAPKKNATIHTPDGPAKVVALDVPREIITLKLDDGTEKTVKVPLSAFDEPVQIEGKDHIRPNAIGDEAWKDALSKDDMINAVDGIFITSQFTRDDKVGDGRVVHNERTTKENPENSSGRGRRSGKQGKAGTAPSSQMLSDRKRRRRSTKISSTSADRVAGSQDSPVSGKTEKQAASRIRPGQKSSGLRGSQNASDGHRQDESSTPSDGQKKSRSSSRRRSSKKKQAGSDNSKRAHGSSRQDLQHDGSATRSSQGSNGDSRGSEHRRSRRRSHKTSGSSDASPSAQ